MVNMTKADRFVTLIFVTICFVVIVVDVSRTIDQNDFVVQVNDTNEEYRFEVRTVYPEQRWKSLWEHGDGFLLYDEEHLRQMAAGQLVVWQIHQLQQWMAWLEVEFDTGLHCRRERKKIDRHAVWLAKRNFRKFQGVMRAVQREVDAYAQGPSLSCTKKKKCRASAGWMAEERRQEWVRAFGEQNWESLISKYWLENSCEPEDVISSWNNLCDRVVSDDFDMSDMGHVECFWRLVTPLKYQLALGATRLFTYASKPGLCAKIESIREHTRALQPGYGYDNQAWCSFHVMEMLFARMHVPIPREFVRAHVYLKTQAVRRQDPTGENAIFYADGERCCAKACSRNLSKCVARRSYLPTITPSEAIRFAMDVFPAMACDVGKAEAKRMFYTWFHTGGYYAFDDETNFGALFSVNDYCVIGEACLEGAPPYMDKVCDHHGLLHWNGRHAACVGPTCSAEAQFDLWPLVVLPSVVAGTLYMVGDMAITPGSLLAQVMDNVKTVVKDITHPVFTVKPVLGVDNESIGAMLGTIEQFAARHKNSIAVTAGMFGIFLLARNCGKVGMIGALMALGYLFHRLHLVPSPTEVMVRLRVAVDEFRARNFDADAVAEFDIPVEGRGFAVILASLSIALGVSVKTLAGVGNFRLFKDLAVAVTSGKRAIDVVYKPMQRVLVNVARRLGYVVADPTDDLLPMKELAEKVTKFDSIDDKEILRDATLVLLANSAYDDMIQLSKFMVNSRITLDTDQRAGWNTMCMRIKHLKEVADRSPAMAAGFRACPFYLELTGPAGCGKSTMCDLIGLELFRELEDKPREQYLAEMSKFVYARDPATDFWDGYTGQPIVKFDDVSQMVDSQVNPNPSVLEVIRAVNNTPNLLHMANLTEKGQSYMKAKLIMATTNEPMPNLASITTPAAYYRRRNALVRVEVLPAYVNDEGGIDVRKLKNRRRYDTSIFKFHVLDSLTGRPQYALFFDEFMKWVKRRVQLHGEGQDGVLNGLYHYAQTADDGEGKVYAERIYQCNAGSSSDEEVEDETLDMAAEVATSFSPGQSVQSVVGAVRTRWHHTMDSIFAAYTEARSNFGLSSFGIALVVFGAVCAFWKMMVPRPKRRRRRRARVVDSGEELVDDEVDHAQVVSQSKNARIAGKKPVVYQSKGRKTEVCSEEGVSLSSLSSDPNEIECHALAMQNGKKVWSQRLVSVSDLQIEQKTRAETVGMSNMYSLVVRGDDLNVELAKVLFLRGTIALMQRHVWEYLIEFIDEDRSNVAQLVGLNTCTKFNPLMCSVHSYRRRANASVGKDDGDLVLVEFPRTIRSHRDIVPWFIRQKDLGKVEGSTVDMVSTWVPRKQQRASFRERILEDLQPSDPIVVSARGGLKRYFNMWRYSAWTMNGDCGSALMVINRPDLVGNLIGIHGASNNSTNSFGQRVVYEELIANLNDNEWCAEALVTEESVTPEWLNTRNKDVMAVVDAIPGGFPLGVSKFRCHDVPKTSILKTSMHGKLGEVKYAPARLSDFRDESGVLVRPKMMALRKYFVERPLVCVNRVYGAATLYAYKLAKLLTRRDDFTPMSYEDAITGTESEYVDPINRKSSPGFPWKFEHPGKGKHPWLGTDEDWKLDHEELRKAVDERLELAKQNIIRYAPFVDTLKDERRPMDRVKAGKTRVFAAGPLDYNIAMRMYSLPMCAWVCKNNIESGCTIGFDPHGEDPNRLMRMLLRFGNHRNILCGDFKNYDGSLVVDLSTETMAAMERVMKTTGTSTNLDAKIRYVLMRSATFAVHIHEAYVYMCNQGFPSGHPLTAVLNSLNQNVVWRAAFIRMSERYRSLRELSFDDVVSLVCNGDDNLVVFDPEVVSRVGPHEWGEVINELFGMTYTDAEKGGPVRSYNCWNEVSYLKRKFRRVGTGKYVMPLDLDVVIAMPQFYRVGMEEWKQVYDVIEQDVYPELLYHSQDVYERESERVAGVFRKTYGRPGPLIPDWQMAQKAFKGNGLRNIGEIAFAQSGGDEPATETGPLETSTEKVDDEEQLVTFHISKGEVVRQASAVPQPACLLGAMGENKRHDIKDFLARPLNIDTIKLSTTFTQGTMIKRINIPDIFLQASNFANKLKGFVGLNATAVIRVIPVSNALTSGIIRGVWFPYPYGSNDSGYSGDGPGFTLEQVSSMNGNDIYLSSDKPQDFHIPMILRQSFYNLVRPEAPVMQFRLYVYYPVVSENGQTHDPVSLNIQAWMEDVVLRYPTDAPLHVPTTPATVFSIERYADHQRLLMAQRIERLSDVEVSEEVGAVLRESESLEFVDEWVQGSEMAVAEFSVGQVRLFTSLLVGSVSILGFLLQMFGAYFLLHLCRALLYRAIVYTREFFYGYDVQYRIRIRDVFQIFCDWTVMHTANYLMTALGFIVRMPVRVAVWIGVRTATCSWFLCFCVAYNVCELIRALIDLVRAARTQQEDDVLPMGDEVDDEADAVAHVGEQEVATMKKEDEEDSWGIADLVTGVANVAGSVMGALGFSKPPSIRRTIPMHTSKMTTSHNVDGMGATVGHGASAGNVLAPDTTLFGTKQDEMDILNIAKIPGYIDTFAYDTTQPVGHVLAKYVNDPCYMRYTNETLTHTVTMTSAPDAGARGAWKNLFTRAEAFPTPLAWVSNCFQYHAGSIKYIFKISKTSLHKGVLRVSWQPGELTDTIDFTKLYSEIWDISKTNQFEFVVPHSFQSMWIDNNRWVLVPAATGRFQAGTDPNVVTAKPTTMVATQFGPTMFNTNGRVIISVVTVLTGSKAVSGTLGIIAEMCAGDDYRLAGPVQSVMFPSNSVNTLGEIVGGLSSAIGTRRASNVQDVANEDNTWNVTLAASENVVQTKVAAWAQGPADPKEKQTGNGKGASKSKPNASTRSKPVVPSMTSKFGAPLTDACEMMCMGEKIRSIKQLMGMVQPFATLRLPSYNCEAVLNSSTTQNLGQDIRSRQILQIFPHANYRPVTDATGMNVIYTPDGVFGSGDHMMSVGQHHSGCPHFLYFRPAYAFHRGSVVVSIMDVNPRGFAPKTSATRRAWYTPSTSLATITTNFLYERTFSQPGHFCIFGPEMLYGLRIPTIRAYVTDTQGDADLEEVVRPSTGPLLGNCIAPSFVGQGDQNVQRYTLPYYSKYPFVIRNFGEGDYGTVILPEDSPIFSVEVDANVNTDIATSAGDDFQLGFFVCAPNLASLASGHGRYEATSLSFGTGGTREKRSPQLFGFDSRYHS